MLSTCSKSRKLQKQHQDEDDDDDELPPTSVLKETLIGHVIATKNRLDQNHRRFHAIAIERNPGSGHIESSRNIGIHSVVIHPDWRGKNLGHCYCMTISKIIQPRRRRPDCDNQQGKFDPILRKIGFNNLGESECKYAGTTWYDMAIDLVATDDL